MPVRISTPTPTAPRCTLALPRESLVGRRNIPIIGTRLNTIMRMSGIPI